MTNRASSVDIPNFFFFFSHFFFFSLHSLQVLLNDEMYWRAESSPVNVPGMIALFFSALTLLSGRL